VWFAAGKAPTYPGCGGGAAGHGRPSSRLSDNRCLRIDSLLTCHDDFVLIAVVIGCGMAE